MYIIWLVVYLPLWKIWKSVGNIIPNIWKVIKAMFQTTNQLFFWQIISTILKSMSSSMGRIIPYIMENKIHVWNHQPVIEMENSSWPARKSFQACCPGAWREAAIQS